MTRTAFGVAMLALLAVACTSAGAPTQEASPAPTLERTATPIAEATSTPAVTNSPTATPMTPPAIRYHPASARTGIAVVDEVMAEILAGGADALSARVQMTTAPCRDLAIYLFACPPGVPEGTSVSRFNSSSCNIRGIDSVELAREQVRSVIPMPMKIHSVVSSDPSAGLPASYWIYFGVLTEDDQTAAATLWLAADGSIVGFHRCGFPTVSGNWTFLLPPVE
jgi:hypothetical protein